ncbi:MAG: LacI family DNA-binding transcriptional regulator [Candidatus Promineifilaceae bacterium]|nr:LacI family DNA-binding transcriptional regulator [Candidatus Promineifilaceae bacterium]
MAAKRTTSVDVARKAGVAQSTVSRILNGSGHFSPETRQRVLKAAEELDYKPNAFARSLSTQQSEFVGIVMADITNPFYPNVLEKFTTRFQELGLQVLLFNVPPDSDVDDILPRAFEYQLEGLIITSATITSEMANEAARHGLAVVLFNRYAKGSNVSAVCCDNVAGGQLAAQYLLQIGSKKPAYIAGTENTSTNIDREHGFATQLRLHGMHTYLRQQGTYSYQTGYDAAIRLLDRDEPPDAIFCANDIIAMGCMDAARFKLGIRIPGDLAVIGFDDIPASRWPSFSLTTIRQPVNKMIETTLTLLADYKSKSNMDSVMKLEPGRLIERESTRWNRLA